MTEKPNIILSGLALIGAAVVLTVSIFSASQVVSYGGVSASHRKIYFGETILPDHLLYPVVAGADRIILAAVPDSKKIDLCINYGKLRWRYAQQLAEKSEFDLAFVTLTKSQKYFNWVAHSVLQLDAETNRDLIDYSISSLSQNIHHSSKLSAEFNNSQRSVIDGINQQNQVLLGQIQEKFNWHCLIQCF